MSAFNIEDTIIAYYDKRLTDAESAELLHRVSVSPEIRQIFEDHAALRQMAVRAAQQATIAPELEESLFQRIEALRDEEKLPVGFWNIRRLSLAAGAVAIVLAVVASAVNFGSTNNPTVSQFAARDATPISMQFDVANANFMAPASTVIARTFHLPTQDRVPGDNGDVQQDPGTSNISSAEVGPSIIPIEMEPSARTEAAAIIPGGIEAPRSIESFSELGVTDAVSKFELELSTPEGSFVGPAPANKVSLPAFPEWSAAAAYNFDGRNLVGVKVTVGQFAGLAIGAPSTQYGYTLVTAAMQRVKGSLEELLYHHREPVANGLFFVTGGIGAGLYNNSFGSLGNVLTAELGLEIPFGDKFLGGVSFVADRLHQSGSPQSVLNSASGPTMFAGDNQYNTLAGHIEYGLTYKF